MLTLAADAKELTPQQVASLQFWGMMVAVASAVLWIVVTYIRKRTQNILNSGPVPEFSLDDLRQLHAKGQLSDEEFTRAKAKMIAQVKYFERRKAEAKARKQGLNPVMDLSEDSDINSDDLIAPDDDSDQPDTPNPGGPADR